MSRCSRRAGESLDVPLVVARPLRGLAQHEPPRRRQPVPSLIALVAPAWTTPADFPPRAVVSARCAPHHDAAALEVQHRIVSTQAADPLSEARDRPIRESLGAACFPFRRCCRELLGIVRHHWTVTLSPRSRTPAQRARFRPERYTDIKPRATRRRPAENLRRISVLAGGGDPIEQIRCVAISAGLYNPVGTG